MADMPYPYYRLQADGPQETGMVLLFQVATGSGGPLPNVSKEDLLAHLKEYLAGDSGDVTARLTAFDVTVTYDV
ncbi:hypothetical protein [Streptomyces shenzhenensis]|uniref:hypothetical protein n=1 Tax=Streptomyces shenzhenensis TaxID=943815 RepID=UPI0036B37EE9